MSNGEIIVIPESARLSIGDVAQRSGLEVATIRSWESRYGFPQADRLAGGHRRYTESESELVAEAARLRQAGLSVEAAIAAARSSAAPASSSFYAHLRARNPGLQPQLLAPPVLKALTFAMEDEYCARAERATLWASFQREQAYRRSEARWREFSRTAASAVVFADFPALVRRDDRPVEVPVAGDAPIRREWALVCDAPGYSACVAAWEVPGSRYGQGDRRRFETVWTLDGRAVREASRVALSVLAERDAVLADELGRRLMDVPPPSSSELNQATALFSRVLAYAQRT
jgi:DICT domain-containing protein